MIFIVIPLHEHSALQQSLSLSEARTKKGKSNKNANIFKMSSNCLSDVHCILSSWRFDKNLLVWAFVRLFIHSLARLLIPCPSLNVMWMWLEPSMGKRATKTNNSSKSNSSTSSISSKTQNDWATKKKYSVVSHLTRRNSPE